MEYYNTCTKGTSSGLQHVNLTWVAIIPTFEFSHGPWYRQHYPSCSYWRMHKSAKTERIIPTRFYSTLNTEPINQRKYAICLDDWNGEEPKGEDFWTFGGAITGFFFSIVVSDLNQFSTTESKLGEDFNSGSSGNFSDLFRTPSWM